MTARDGEIQEIPMGALHAREFQETADTGRHAVTRRGQMQHRQADGHQPLQFHAFSQRGVARGGDQREGGDRDGDSVTSAAVTIVVVVNATGIGWVIEGGESGRRTRPMECILRFVTSTLWPKCHSSRSSSASAAQKQTLRLQREYAWQRADAVAGRSSSPAISELEVTDMSKSLRVGTRVACR